MKSKQILFLAFGILFSIKSFSQNNAENRLKPIWLDSLIAKGKIGNSPITNIKSYIFKEKLVYLVNFDAACCDQFSSILFDKNGAKLSYPFGGVSGKGDMQTPDFLKEKTEELFVWANPNIDETKDHNGDISKKKKSYNLEKNQN
jgi:hypothetical protein